MKYLFALSSINLTSQIFIFFSVTIALNAGPNLKLVECNYCIFIHGLCYLMKCSHFLKYLHFLKGFSPFAFSFRIQNESDVIFLLSKINLGRDSQFQNAFETFRVRLKSVCVCTSLWSIGNHTCQNQKFPKSSSLTFALNM